MPKLSCGELMRLARKNKLSLPLRHQWFKRTGYDPVNVARLEVNLKVSSFFFCLGLLSLMVTFVFGMFLDVIPETIVYVCAGSGLVSFGICVFSVGPVPSRATGFGEAYGAFRDLIGLGPTHTVNLDLPELRSLAQGILVSAARNVLLGQNVDPEQARDPDEVRVLLNFTEELKHKYDTFALLGLVDGGYRHFYVLAQKEIDEAKNKAEAASQSEASAA